MNGVDMRRGSIFLLIISMILINTTLHAEQPRFKKKIYYGPIPVNNVSLSIGFMDGPSAEYLTDYLNHWAEKRNGMDIFDNFSNSPYARLGYERQVAPDYAFRFSLTFAYLKTSSYGYYMAEIDSIFHLDIRRTFKVYLFALEGGLLYYFIEPKPQSFSPYVGGGLAAVIPLARLDTDSFYKKEPYEVPGSDISRNSLEAGAHIEFGIVYYITNKYGASIEGRYQISQSKFYINNANFDISYNGFTLSMNIYHYF